MNKPQQYTLKEKMSGYVLVRPDGSYGTFFDDVYLATSVCDELNYALLTSKWVISLEDKRNELLKDKEFFRLASLIGCDGEDWQIHARKVRLINYVLGVEDNK